MNPSVKREIIRYTMMVIANLIYAVGFCFFIEPNNIVAGAMTGLAMVVSHFIPAIPVGIWGYILNLPIIIIAFFNQGKKFTVNCLITIIVLYAFIFSFDKIIAYNNISVDLSSIGLGLLPNAVFGAIMQGIAIGLYCKYRCSSGGTELLGRFIHEWSHKKASIPVFNGICDTIIVLLGFFTFKDVSNLFYALIVIFIVTKVSDIVLMGFASSKLCYIITDKGEEIGHYLVQHSPRGVTLINGKGMYTDKKREVLMTVVKKNQLTNLKETIEFLDKNAFMIVSETNEVLGNGFKKLTTKEDD